MISINILLQRKSFDLSINESFGKGITGVFGPSGSGKSSLLNAVAGLTKPEMGYIKINGREVFNAATNKSVPVHQRRIGYVFQDGRLFPHMTVENNLRYGMNKRRDQTLGFEEVVDLLKVGHILTSKPSVISGGEYQRVALGRALLSSPQALLLDEPFSAVDAGLRSQIIPYLWDLHKRISIPMLVVSHEITDLLKLTNRLCILKAGRCVGHGEYESLLGTAAIIELLSNVSVPNAIALKVKTIDAAGGLATLTTEDQKCSIRVVSERCKKHYRCGDEVKIFLKSDDISLSLNRVSGSTFQNQLEGTVVAIQERDSTCLCLIDVGFRLVVEITGDSCRRMQLEPGSRVWSLFKSIAIDVAS